MPKETASALTRFRTGIALALCLLGAAGCDHLLKVQDPDVATPGQVTGKNHLNLQLPASLSTFQVAFGGDGTGDEGLINLTGLFTDEFSFTETFPTRIVIDQRRQTNNNSTLLATFFNIEQARATASNASDQFNQFAAGTDDHSQVLSLEAYSELLLAETYCSDIPFTHQNTDGTFTNSAALTTSQVMNAALATFDSALAIPDSTPDQVNANLARIGKARALLDLGGAENFAIADTVVTSVPTSFFYKIFHSTNSGRENNGVNELIWQEGRWSVSDSEGINGLPFVSDNDPRVLTRNIGRGFASHTVVFAPLADSDRTSPDILASGIEARLIEAEVALSQGNTATWLSILNTLRASGIGIPAGTSLAPLSDPGTAAARLHLMFRERAYWMFGSSHRLGDMRRLTRSTTGDPAGYGLAIDAVYPTGNWIYKGAPAATYGTDVNFPIPLEEGNNPQFNNAQCDLTQP